jgi:hypothetical protein
MNELFQSLSYGSYLVHYSEYNKEMLYCVHNKLWQYDDLWATIQNVIGNMSTTGRLSNPQVFLSPEEYKALKDELGEE